MTVKTNMYTLHSSPHIHISLHNNTSTGKPSIL